MFIKQLVMDIAKRREAARNAICMEWALKNAR